MEHALPTKTKRIRTVVYVDGYNLYYGRLRGTSYKWLDVVKLFEKILADRDQNEELTQVKVFTAHALANFATNREASVIAQSSYHRALQVLYGERYKPIYGKHSFDRSGTLLPEFVEGQPYDRHRRVRVWKLEEKQTDVNLAINMFADAMTGHYDRLILVSNDSDAEPALQAIKNHFPKIVRGVVMPIRSSAGGGPRRASGSLSNIADWVIGSLSDQQLQEAQLPDMIATKKKPIFKPAHWFAPEEPTAF
ncbi:NYN domain-containing protein [Herbaspirillum huttiense]|uniref:NYN domain-containing protein n=1 Tax=Herbaspirillum huttiense TaxID=863372 RepID=UPI00196AA84C|nr:NYN domain-containing protein [Herbaspirillum huttiense]